MSEETQTMLKICVRTQNKFKNSNSQPQKFHARALATTPPEQTELSDHCSAVQRQKAVSAYFTSEQILPFAFAEQCYGHMY